jgi:hypothetical protein
MFISKLTTAIIEKLTTSAGGDPNFWIMASVFSEEQTSS